MAWEDYASARRNGTLDALLPSEQEGAVTQAGTQKRPLDAVANSGVSAMTGQAVAGDSAPPMKKKLKTMLPNCRMM